MKHTPSRRRPWIFFLWLIWAGVAFAAGPVPIGYYGPADETHPVGGTAWLGFTLAVEEANAAGGYQGRPFRVVQEWDENQWTGGAAGVVRMAYQERVVGIVGSIDGDSTHLAEQVVAKALLPLIDPLTTDRTVNAAFVPWMFSVLPDDEAHMRALVRGLPAGKFVLVSSTAHDPRITTRVFLKTVAPRTPVRHIQFDEPAGVAADVAGIECDFVVVLAGVGGSAQLVRDLRALHPGLPIYGGPQMGRRSFRESAGDAANGIFFPAPFPLPGEFAGKFRARFGSSPDYASVSAYDAARLLITAIRTAGTDRSDVRDALEQLSPYDGSSGPIRWSTLRRNERECRLVTVDVRGHADR